MANKNVDPENLIRMIHRPQDLEILREVAAPAPQPSPPSRVTIKGVGDSLKSISELFKDQALINMFQKEGIQKITVGSELSDRKICSLLYESRISNENLLFRYHLIHKEEFRILLKNGNEFKVTLFIGGPVGRVSDGQDALWFWTP